jgi:hypothetical protein
MEDGPGLPADPDEKSQAWLADSDDEGQEWLVDSDEEGQGWLADPDEDGQERYFDGAEWTSEVRPADADLPLRHLPDHVPELQRAFAAATADIDEVEARLGLLFDRAEAADAGGSKGRKASKRKAAAVANGAGDEAPAAAPPNVESMLGTEGGAVEVEAGEVGSFEDFEGDDDALAELDEALASEEPEHIKRGRFRRRA